MKKWFNNNYLLIIGAALGALVGYLYWKYIGCISGTCAITSKPLNSTLYFSVLGALLFSLFKKTAKKDAHVE
ncbi:DUF6132 family protein [Sediminibacterium sp.]|uniref:DUF6132 family protein n=1 Tax=Sediminibacterium sp. TaxID=1917865 RepID=UPI0025F8EB76|nr:DUF6132 family protein [Sediminibacterium sp.]MBW0177009.1 hypothetical protein [Sediminibacterium sp.]